LLDDSDNYLKSQCLIQITSECMLSPVRKEFHPNFRHDSSFSCQLPQISHNFRTTMCEMKRNNVNHLGGGPVVRVWDQEVCSLCGLKFEPCGCSYDGHWRLTWSLTSGPVRLVEVRASWPGHPR